MRTFCVYVVSSYGLLPFCGVTAMMFGDWKSFPGDGSSDFSASWLSSMSSCQREVDFRLEP